MVRKILKKDIPKNAQKADGWTCPDCGAFLGSDSLVATTAMVADKTSKKYQYEWAELHECKICGTVCTTENNTPHVK